MNLFAEFNKKADYEAIAHNWLSLLFLSTVIIGALLIMVTPSYANIKDATQIPQQVLNKNTLSLDKKELQKIATDKQWQHLLFYKKGRAEVISPNFYLSDPKAEQKRNFSFYQELIATLNQSSNPTTVCKYPARYYWLNHHIPELNINLSHCQNLPNAEQDVSIILVSSYLKNPASTFGHVLIKTNDGHDNNGTYDNINDVNTDTHINVTSHTVGSKPSDILYNQYVKTNTSKDLLNQSYNFGARIPDNENGVLYALKGLFGIYDAGFSKADFFKQDAVYSKNEQRDMWEYVLNLDEFNTTLLNYHLYEAQSARFNYYFIKQNCGYRSGELLELVSDISTTDRKGGWYAPDYVFDQLVEYSGDKDVKGSQKTLIKKSMYLPSEQTQLLQKFSQLPAHLQQPINDFINTDDMKSLGALNKKEQALTIDFLITHRNYKISQAGGDEKTHHETVKKHLISKRFALPISDDFAKLPLTFKPSPALSNKTTQTSFTVSDESFNVGLTLFAKDPLSNYTDLNKRFKAVHMSAQYLFDDNDTTNKQIFDEFTFLDMQQIENYYQPLAGEPKMSWQMRTGVQLDPIEGSVHMPYIESGVGTGIELLSTHKLEALGYGFVNAHIHDQKNVDSIGYLDASAEVGIRIKDKINSRAGEVEYSLRKRDGKSLVQKTKLTIRQGINKNNDLRMGLSYTDNANLDSYTTTNDGLGAELSYNYFW